MQYFFLVISPRQTEAPDEPVFSNVCRRHPAMSLEEIADTLHRYGITAPAGLFRDLAEDQALNRGTLEVSYDALERGATPAGQSDDRAAERPRERSAIDALMQASPAPDHAGVLYRATYASGYVGILDAEGLRIAQLDATSPAWNEGTTIARVERLQDGRWVRHDPWHARDHVETPSDGPAHGAASAGQSDESPGEGATVMTRIRELADRVREWFSRSQGRGMDL